MKIDRGTGPTNSLLAVSSMSVPDEESLPDLGWLLQRIWRHIDIFGFRMAQSNGTLDSSFVSLVEVERVMRSGNSAGFASRLKLDPPAFGVSTSCPWLLERLAMLRTRFGLDMLETQLLVAAVAASLSVDIARLYTFAWADFVQKRPSVGFLAEFVSDDPESVSHAQTAFLSDSRLVRLRLVEIRPSSSWGPDAPLIHRDVVVPESVVTFLRGPPPRLPTSLVRRARIFRVGVDDALGAAPGPPARYDVALSAVAQPDPAEPVSVLTLVGEQGIGRRHWIAHLARHCRRSILEIRLDLLPGGDGRGDALADGLREARMHRHLMVLDGDAYFREADDLDKLAGRLDRQIAEYRVPGVILAREALPALCRTIDRLVQVQLPLPTRERQCVLWAEALDEVGLPHAPTLPSDLALRFNTSPGMIRRASADTRRQFELEHGPGDPPEVQLHHVAAQMRRRISHALEEVATPVETTLGWDSVVLPSETRELLDEIVSQARLRSTVYDEWGMRSKMSNGRGLACLFAGAPGTGKTLVAGVIARELGRELYRIDLSRVVSKWVGETEKNLARVFDEAEKAQVILLFDEADSLFAKRTEVKGAQDRFANMEVNFLLQKMEEYDGISILTTNFEQSLDEALKRRLRFRVNFPKPDVAERTLLWERLLPPKLPIDDGIDFERLGRKFKLTGALIRNAILRASFYSAEGEGRLTEDLLIKAIRREQRDMGRL